MSCVHPLPSHDLRLAPTIVPVDLSAVAPVSRLATLNRILRIGSVVIRRLAPVVAAAGPFRRDESSRRWRVGHALSDALSDLGVTFVKFGQVLASSPSLAGDTISKAMRGLLDEGTAVCFYDVRSIIEKDLERPIETVFSSFEALPFAAASLAVVHKATLGDGTEVAVKILRPECARIVATDLSILRPLARRLARAVPVGYLPSIPEIVEGLAEQLSEELDLRNEARAMAWFAGMIELIGARGVLVPRTIPHACGARVLTMEFIEGSKVDDLEAILNAGVDAPRAVEALIEAWFALTLCTGVFHGDIHAGNLLITASGDVALLDWGIVGRLPDESVAFFRRSLEGALGDEGAWPDVRDHVLTTLPPEVLRSAELQPDEFLEMVRSQTLAIMTAPFSEVDLTMLAPTTRIPTAPDSPVATTGLERLRLIREERRRARRGEGISALAQPMAPPRGEILLMKQLLYFERYGKMFLRDRPLLYDPAVYEALLRLPALSRDDGEPDLHTNVQTVRS
jgi:hypothetical protein